MKTSIFKKCALGAAVLMPLAGIGGIGVLAGVAGAQPTSVTLQNGGSPSAESQFDITIGAISVVADLNGTYTVSATTGCNTSAVSFTTNNSDAPTVYVPPGDFCFDYAASDTPPYSDFYIQDGGTASTDTYAPLAGPFAGCTLQGLTGSAGLVDFVGSGATANPFVAATTNMDTPSIVTTPGDTCTTSEQTTLTSEMSAGVSGSGTAYIS